MLSKIEDVEDTKDYLVCLTAGKTLKKVSMKNYSKSQKVISENSTLFDIHTFTLQVKSTDTVLIFTDKGNCLKVPVDKLAGASGEIRVFRSNKSTKRWIFWKRQFQF